MAGLGAEGSQFDARQYDAKMNDLRVSLPYVPVVSTHKYIAYDISFDFQSQNLILGLMN